MTALQKNRNTVDDGFDVLPHFMSIPVADNVHVFGLGLVGIDSAGRARPATLAATTPIIAGRAELEADNTVAGHTAGGISVLVKCGIFKWNNDTGTPVTNASRGMPCYALDDQTVSGSSGGSTRPIAGVVIDVPSDCSGVMVQTFFAGQSGSDATTLAGELASGGLALGDLQKISYTPGVSTGGFCDVVCGITDLAGNAISAARQVVIKALGVTGGTGKDVLAAATSAVGTIISSAGANAAAGMSTLLMDTGATGLFSFKVTDAANEALFVEIIADGCRPFVKKITISGN